MKKTIKFIFIFIAFFLFLGNVKITRAEGGKITAYSNKIEVIYFSDIQKENAIWIKNAALHTWSIYKQATNVSPNKITFYVGDFFISLGRDAGSVSPLGLTHYQGHKKCYVLISNIDKKTTEAVTAHEMFHCWQYTLEIKPYVDNKWFWEATAEWAISWVYPKNNFEQKRLPLFFKHLNENFFKTGRTREYGSYLFFYYLFQKNNFNPSKILKIVKSLKTKEQKEAIESISNFREKFKEYALWNWNQDIAKKYKDDPSFPDLFPSGNALSISEIRKDEKNQSGILVDNGGMNYLFFKIDDNIKKLTFNLKDANNLTNKDYGLQALIKIKNNWKYEDWSNIKSKTFCRHRENEKVQDIVLIFSDSKLSLNMSGDESGFPTFNYDASSECPKVWHGKTTFTGNGKTPFGKHSYKLILEEELDPKTDKWGDKHFIVKKQNVSYYSNSTTNMSCPFIGCNGSIIKTVDEQGQTTRSIKDRTDSKKIIYRFYALKGEKLKFNPSAEIYGKCDYVTIKENSSFNCTCPGPLGNSSESGSDTKTNKCHSVEGEDFFGEPIAEIKNNHIKGKIKGASFLGTKTTVEWDYVYE